MSTITTTEGETLDLPILHVVDRSRAGRKLAIALGVLIVIVPFLLAFTPWQQNVQGTGRVTVVEPELRIRQIPAPITGRISKTYIQEGSVVKAGDLLIEMEDQDSSFFERLQLARNLAAKAVTAAKDELLQIDEELIQLEEKRDAEIAEAEFKQKSAFEKVNEAREKVKGAEAKLEQKELDYTRKEDGYNSGVISQLDFEEAVRDRRNAKAELAAAKANVENMVNEEQGAVEGIAKVRSDNLAKIANVMAKREKAKQVLVKAEQDFQDSEAKVSRQATQTVKAPVDGRILSIDGAASQDLISKNDPLITFVPSGGTMAVEMYMRGIDAPLISPGRNARLVFEGWPAVQFAGWPSVAVGTFGGVVSFVESQALPDGRVRILILPDPDEDIPWPDDKFLRQGVRVTGWVQLDTVSVGYEIWRQLNAFPPSIQIDPSTMTKEGKEKKSSDKGEKKETGL